MDNRPPHFILVPLMAQGHTIPMIDMAHLLAARGAHITFVTTPANAARICSVIDRARLLALPIHFLSLPFPSSDAGIPEGCENIDQITCPDHYLPFFKSMSLLKKPLELHIRSLLPPPTCIISDNCHWWTAATAREFNLPRFIFHGPSCFYLLACHNIRKHDAYGKITDDHEPIVVPELPHKVEITRAQEPGSWFAGPGWEELGQKVSEAERTAEGVLINTFYELEPQYVESYSKELRPKLVLPIGPLYLHNKIDKATRGNKTAICKHKISGWLDSKDPGSVLYVSFGSIAQKPPAQLIELARGLEATGRPFVWVVKEAERSQKFEEWMAEYGFADRTKGRGLIITGWAPQVLTLSHPAIGGFLTHCGWNSILEAISAGLPMITWPHFADQFLNERLLVDVLGIGVGIGVERPTLIAVATDEVVVTKDEVVNVVSRLMDGGKEGEERRRRAREFGEKANKAMDEEGSSYENVSKFIDHIMEMTN